MRRFTGDSPLLLRVAAGALLLAVAAAATVLLRGPGLDLAVSPERARAGEHLRLRTTAPKEWGRGLYTRMERREAGRWRPVLDLAPEWEATGPPHAKPAEGDEAAGLAKAFQADGIEVLHLPDDVAAGRYRLRQRLFKPGPVKRDLYVELEVR